ncbi:neprilysin-4-like [Dermacentor andersoni]|uniref:neprilysin-4-like n=1 Tax=Dermacentor andersoni TaxID=34620 RepID=UPI002416487F|nr:neprilysin-4-like [Dermacentor andersoni]
METEESIFSATPQSTTKGRNWSECIALLDETTPDILDYVYITNYTDPTVNKEVERIASNLRQALNETVQNITWLNDTTRKAVEKKLEELTLTIGYPEVLRNISVLEARYKYVPFFPLNISFIEAFYHLREGLYKMHLSKLWNHKKSSLGRDYSPRNVRPIYDLSRNTDEIPYALFASPFYQQDLPRSLNYGGIGGTIAHELAARLFAEMKKSKIPSDRNSLDNKTSCFEKQYKSVNKKLLLENYVLCLVAASFVWA